VSPNKIELKTFLALNQSIDKVKLSTRGRPKPLSVDKYLDSFIRNRHFFIREKIMKVLCILGSPRKKGNTARVLAWAEEEMKAGGHEVERLNILDHKVEGCAECYTCHKSLDKPGCARKDDGLDVFERMMNADALVYASPLFCWGYSAQIKPLIDRHYCLVKEFGAPGWKSFIQGRPAGLIVTCAGPEKGNADLIVEEFKRLMHYTKTRMAGTLVVPFATTPDNMGDDVRQRAVEFASIIVGSRS
jgi:multimeric flavodoxin WrbA